MAYIHNMNSSPQQRICPNIAECYKSIRAPELYRNFAIHLFVMLPAAIAMCLIASHIDHAMAYGFPIAAPSNILLGLTCIGIGGLWVWYVYGYLYLAGGGSPGTHVDGGPVRMVDTGPYTAIRHPSVLGKLLGVTGLGIIWQSPTFLLGFLPILVIYSVVSNRLLQERFCEDRFGERYVQYREQVPMLIPRPSGITRWRQGKPALDAIELLSVSQQPPGVWKEFRWYLIGLIGLLSCFGGMALMSQLSW